MELHDSHVTKYEIFKISIVKFEPSLLLNGPRWEYTICNGNVVPEKSF